MRKLRAGLYDMFHALENPGLVYWPLRAILRQFKRRP